MVQYAGTHGTLAYTPLVQLRAQHSSPTFVKREPAPKEIPDIKLAHETLLAGLTTALVFGGMIMVAAGSTVRAAAGALDAAEAQ